MLAHTFTTEYNGRSDTNGVTRPIIDVMVDVSPGLSDLTIVGRPSPEVDAEGRHRIRTALANSGFLWPDRMRVTVLLSPADLHKSGTLYDLPIALAFLAASGQIDPVRLDHKAFWGELMFDGALRAANLYSNPRNQESDVTCGAASAGRAGLGIRQAIMPEPNVEAAARVKPNVALLGFRSLAQVVAHLNGTEIPDAPPCR